MSLKCSKGIGHPAAHFLRSVVHFHYDRTLNELKLAEKFETLWEKSVCDLLIRKGLVNFQKYMKKFTIKTERIVTYDEFLTKIENKIKQK